MLHEGPWATNDIVIFNTTQEAVRRSARAPRAVAGHRPLERQRGAVQDHASSRRRAACCGRATSTRCRRRRSRRSRATGATSRSRVRRRRRLLKEAGQENLKFQLHNRTLAEPYTPVGVFLIDQWRRIGVTVEHSQVETTPYFGNLVDGKFEVALYPVTVPADDVTAQHQSYSRTRSRRSATRATPTPSWTICGISRTGRSMSPSARRSCTSSRSAC